MNNINKRIGIPVLVVAGVLLLTVSPARAEEAPKDRATTPTFSFPPAGQARPIDAKGLDQLLKTHGKRLLVVNFWATWCAPCVAELPHFVQVYNEYRKDGVLFVGLSTDFLDSWKTTVPPFLKEKKIDYPNFVLDVDPNDLIPKFAKDWSGAIPATFFFDQKGHPLGHHIGKVEKAVLEKDIQGYLKAEKKSGK